MSAHSKTANAFARQLFKLSIEGGVVSAARVAGVLEYVEKHKVANPIIVLRAYRRLIETELARTNAVVEHAGAIADTVLPAIAAALSKKVGRPVAATARPNPALIAGMRVHLGDDIFEASLSGQLAALAQSV